MRIRTAAVTAALALVVAAAPAVARTASASASAPRVLVGTGRADITPPPFSASADAAAFPLCPPTAFPGPRPFAFEEPYVDSNGDGRFDYGEPFCDANHNGRYDGLYLSGAVDHLAVRVHDPIDARAVAFSDGRHTAVLASVVSQGLFDNQTQRISDRIRQLRPGVSGVIVSANHNESSPDSIGLYGGPDTGAGVGLRSGIDDYYMAFLVERVAEAAVRAVDAVRPAQLYATQYRLPDTLAVRLSKNFPTTNDDGTPAAIDPKVGLLQARTIGGTPIFTMMSLAAHNQEVGHDIAPSDISADWPGYFHQALESQVPGMAMFLVGDNGSEEDPQTVPPVPACGTGCYDQPAATGRAMADALRAHLGDLQPVAGGEVAVARDDFFVPLDNNLFKAAAATGLFGDRQTYLAGVPAGGAGDTLKTSVSVLRVGPDLELLANPAESFPALMIGSPWGIEDASCPDRPNPPVPTWRSGAKWRFQVGLANDLVGYLSPAWGFSTQPGIYATTCFNDANDRDPQGHQHKLETESVGYRAGNMVAEHLTALLKKDSAAASRIVTGRFLLPDGTMTRRAEGAVGVWLSDGSIIARAGISHFGRHRVTAHGVFMDYDGAQQPSPDLMTRGMLVGGKRPFYLDVYPALTTSSLGAAGS